jgi:hypothetical protein
MGRRIAREGLVRAESEEEAYARNCNVSMYFMRLFGRVRHLTGSLDTDDGFREKPTA